MRLLLACGRLHFTLRFDCCVIAGHARAACTRALLAESHRLWPVRRLFSDFAERMLEIGADRGTYQANQKSVVGIEVSANSLIDGIAGGAAAHHPLRIQQATRADQVKVLKQLRILLLRLTQVIADHVQGHYR